MMDYNPDWGLAEIHILMFEDTKADLEVMEDYYGDHLAITDLLKGHDIRPFGDDPDYQSEFESLKRECKELEAPLFKLFQESREL